VHSARYAGEPQDSGRNIAKLLEAMRGVENRRAYFQAALCLCDESGSRIFEGRCDGSIADAPGGEGGFGYDPVFIPDGYTESFGALPPDVKARLSHRAKALQQLVAAVYPA
jgi:XTP/dITP diphosphohydrolase